MECDLKLWYAIHQPDIFPEESISDRLLLEQGREVGLLARTLFPGGIEIGWEKSGWEKSIQSSKELLSQKALLFEPGFQYEDLFARLDILIPSGSDKWDIIEVKSSSSVKEEYYWDVAFQKYIMEKSEIPVQHCYLLHINSDYIRTNGLEPGKLFTREDISKQVDRLLSKIPGYIDRIREIIQLEKPPSLHHSQHCDGPRSCPIPGICWSFLPQRHIFLLHGDKGKKRIYELWKKGILSLSDIPEKYDLSGKQKIQWNTEISGEPHIDMPSLKHFVKRLQFPLYFLDFETFASAIPRFKNTGPYKNIPFQYSLHIWNSCDGPIKHNSFLSDGKKDPRPEILKRLKTNLGNHGSIIAYSAQFEMNILKDSAKYYTEFQPWTEKLLPRFIDLLVPFRSFSYYHPAQNGNTSLKNILPIFTGKNYKNLEIREGGQASAEFLRLISNPLPDKEKLKIRKALEIYCAQDTDAMVDLIKSLFKITNYSSHHSHHQ